jgi:capsule polysaccharide export protein KpsC/LpsZ
MSDGLTSFQQVEWPTDRREAQRTRIRRLAYDDSIVAAALADYDEYYRRGTKTWEDILAAMVLALSEKCNAQHKMLLEAHNNRSPVYTFKVPEGTRCVP